MPNVTTPRRLVEELVARTGGAVEPIDPLLREALLRRAFDHAVDADIEPPFEIRGGLARRVLELYDTVRTNGYELDAFAERALEELDAPDDDGAEKLAQQTRFLHASLDGYQRAVDALGLVDDVAARRALAEHELPYTDVLVLGAETLAPIDLDLLSNADALDTFVVASAESSAELPEPLQRAASHVRVDDRAPPPPSRLRTREPIVSRDREESLVDATRVLKALDVPPHRVAVVVPSPLPYLYLAKKVLDEAGIDFELHDSFPLASEPYVAAVDLALELVASNAHRTAALAMLRSPFFTFDGVDADAVAAFDELTLRYREPGGWKRWRSLYDRKKEPPAQPTLPGMESQEATGRILPPLRALVEAEAALAALADPAPISDKIQRLRDFLERTTVPSDDPRHRRARAATRSILERLETAARLVGDAPVAFTEFRDQLKRAVEAHTFDLRTGAGGVRVVDARSAGFGAFDLVLLLGVNDGEWPSRGERNIFYPQWLLREFGWPSDRELLARERTRFRSLLDLSAGDVFLLRHQLESEIPTVPSPLIEEVEDVEESAPFDEAALRASVVTRSEALRHGITQPETLVVRDRTPGDAGVTSVPDPISPTSLELYRRCPFKYFSRYLLGLEEEEEVDEMLTPLERGRILHDVLQEGFEAWDGGAEGPRAVTAENYEEALGIFRDVAMKKIRPEHRRVELPRLFGGAGEPGAVEWLLRRELARGPLVRRLVEYGFQSPLRLERGPRGESPWFVRIKGRVDRADLDKGGGLHVYDYKSGRAPESAVTLQVPLYAMCLSQELEAPIREAAYLSFAERRAVARDDFQATSALLVDTVHAIQEGDFAPRPYRDTLCFSCGFVGTCRKEIAVEEGA